VAAIRPLARFGWVSGLAVLVALTQLALQLWQVARGEAYRATALACDDTFYYLQTAWNFKQLGVVTFDGLHTTNGVQFLWFWVTAGLAYLVSTKTVLLTVTLVVCAGLNALCCVPMLRLARRLNQPTLAVLLALAWSFVTARFYLSGMENSLHAFVLWCLVAELVAVLQRLATCPVRRPALERVTLLLVLLVWIRVDQALYAVVLGGLLGLLTLVRGGWSATRGTLVRSAVAAGLGAVILLAGFEAMGGTRLPVSALIKSGYLGWGTAAGQEVLLRGLEQAFPLSVLAAWRLPTAWAAPVAAFLAAIVTFVGLVVAHRRAAGGAAAARGFTVALVTLVVLAAVHTAYLAGLGDFAVYGRWYFSPLFVTGTLLTGLALQGISGWFAVRMPAWPVAQRAALGGAVALLALCAGLRQSWTFASDARYARSLAFARYELAQWVAQNVEPSARCAAWSAGVLGYYSERPVINLDGLVNGADYYAAVLKGRERLTDYLRNENVRYVIDYEFTDDVRAVTEAVTLTRSYGGKTGQELEVRRLTPLAVAAE
jgi:hypothetical protein